MKSVKALTWKKDAQVIIGLVYSALILAAIVSRALGLISV